jgi:outer membrane protein assembly factor BamB
MHRTLSTAVIKDDLLVIADLSGLVHCLDARTGRVHWTYDMLSAVWGTPLVADGKIYLGDEDGDMVVFALAPTLKVLAKNNMGAAIYTTPVAADGMLFVATRTHLVAVGPGK